MNFWSFLGGAILFSGIIVMSGARDVVGDSAVLKSYSTVRNRLLRSNSSFQRVAGSEEGVGNKGMGDIWEKASRIARGDIEALRLLHSVDMMSMSLSKSNDNANRPPTILTTPEPTSMPILDPMPSTTPVTTPSPQSIPSPEGPDLDPDRAPSVVEDVPKNEYIFKRLELITKPEILLDASTPQGKAYDYLANDDTGITDHTSYSTLEQRYGLTTFFFATNGNGWKEKDGWLGDEHECSWFGVDCDDMESSSYLTRLLLPNNNLAGSLTEEIGTLEKLQRFDVFSNTLTGTMPTNLTTLTDLVLLDLEENRIGGLAFPDELFELKSLVSYRISNNMFSGTIPSDISRLDQLCQLWAADNLLTGSIPKEIGASGKLESILLYDNRLNGSIPKEIGTLENLHDLQIYNNTLQFGIPSELFSALQLENLRLDYNFLTGGLPSEIGNLVNLKDFRLDFNSLFGEIPPEIGALSKLKNFVINNNYWIGTFPDVFQGYTSLDFFDISNSNFKGTIPESLFRIPTIRIAYLSNNTFTGTIPQDFSSATLLRDLFLDGNALTGTVPDIVEGQFQSLTEFLVQFNFLTGTMPESICNLRENGNLIVLFSDCGGSDPEIECRFPECCNRCFEGGDTAATGRRLSSSSLRHTR